MSDPAGDRTPSPAVLAKDCSTLIEFPLEEFAAQGAGALHSALRYEIRGLEEKAGRELGCSSLTPGAGCAVTFVREDLYPQQPAARHPWG